MRMRLLSGGVKWVVFSLPYWFFSFIIWCVLDESLSHSIALIHDVLIACDGVELPVNKFFLAFQGFGQVRVISRASSGCLYVDFKKASVAETVCCVSLIFSFFGFRFVFRVSGSSFFGSGSAFGWMVWWVDDKVDAISL